MAHRFISLILLLASSSAVAADGPKKAWYEKFSLRGYTQVRYNRLLETNPDLRCEQCDKSWGNRQSFFIRRARLILSGYAHERVFVYIQPDLATDANGNQHYLQLRDLYFDVYVDPDKDFRLRVGQSKVPFGWENLQSSSNRLPQDRSDAINSAAPNERDLGVFAYWSPSPARERFKELLDKGLKGSGDYGVLGIGAYNGQSANKPELNNNRHLVAHATYPWALGEQLVETGVHAYSGLFNVSQRTSGVTAKSDYTDRRVAASFVLYPQPFGLQAEWNVGDGPEYVSASNSIETTRLHGGYVLAEYQLRDALGLEQSLIPFTRAHFYHGGKKQELDARSYRVREYELGVEWAPIPAFELTAMYVLSHRKTSDAAKRDNLEQGNLLRLQAQFNY